MTGIAALLRGQQPETALAQIQAALAPVIVLDANAEALTTTLGQLTAAWTTLLTMCSAGTMPVAVLTDPAAVRMVAEAAETVSEYAQELSLRAVDRVWLLDQRTQG